MARKAISDTTRAQIKAYLEVFVEHLVREYKGRPVPALDTPTAYLAQSSRRGQLKPFHAAIIPSELMRVSAFERGFSTALGTTFEECARLIALEHHADAQRGYAITGQVSLAALAEVERQVAALEAAAAAGMSPPSVQQMAQHVLDARRSDDPERRVARADLYILTKDGARLFFEMKSPQPNKGQCLEVTLRILRIHLILGQSRPAVQAYYAMAYNPYGPTRAEYAWSFGRMYMPFADGVLIGHEFWDIIGGPGAYPELLAIYQEVGREKGKYMLDALAFGF